MIKVEKGGGGGVKMSGFWLTSIKNGPLPQTLKMNPHNTIH